MYITNFAWNSPGIALVKLVRLVVLAGLFAATGKSGEVKPVRIGLAKTLLSDKSKGYVDIAQDDFKDLMKKTMGLEGQVFTRYGAFELAEKLEKKDVDLAIFHGHEFAWVQKRHADFTPILVAVNKQREERAYLIVRKDGAIKTVADLRGKTLDMPAGTKEVCRLFLEKHCTDKEHKEPAKFFSAIEKSATPETALDNVARGKIQAAIVDTVALALYKELRGPVFEKNLKVLLRSDPFPPVVIVCKTGGLSEATLNKFRDGLLKAHDFPEGRDLMETWKVSAFEPVPKDYAKSLADVLKRYPPP